MGTQPDIPASPPERSRPPSFCSTFPPARWRRTRAACWRRATPLSPAFPARPRRSSSRPGSTRPKRPSSISTARRCEVFDLQDLRGPARSQLVRTPKPFSAKASQIGQVFGVTLDYANPPNIYVAASSAYGLPIVAAGADGELVHIRKGQAGARFMPGLVGRGGARRRPGLDLENRRREQRGLAVRQCRATTGGKIPAPRSAASPSTRNRNRFTSPIAKPA